MLPRLVQTLGIAVIAIAAGALLFFYMSRPQASPLVPIDWNLAEASQMEMPYPVIAAVAAQVEAPENLESPSAVEAGAHLFRENCVQCHGAPGIAPVVQGFMLADPNLLLAGRRNDPAEVFPKIKNGIPGTGMPAWDNQLPDQGVWALAAFLHHSRGISVDAFDALSTAAPNASQQGHCPGAGNPAAVGFATPADPSRHQSRAREDKS